MYNRILVPIDGSAHSQHALRIACQLLEGNDSTLHLLHVPEALTYAATLVWGLGAVNAEASNGEREALGKQLLEQAAKSAAEYGARHVENQLIQGDPVRVILATAEECRADAIVMGSRGLSDLGGVVIGSVSHKVSHLAKCHVITASQ